MARLGDQKTSASWLFGYGSPVTMGVMRMLIGSLAFINFGMVAIDFDAWFAERGYVPWRITEQWLGTEWRINLLSGVTDTRITAVFYCLVMIAAFLTAIGLWTRVSSIALALGAVTLSHRNPIILHGGDTMLRLMIIYVAVAPSGLSCSMDRLIALWKCKAQTELKSVSLWPQRIMQYQVALVYFTTVYHKWGGSHWRDGTATWYPANLREFDRFPAPSFIDTQPFIMLFTYGTLLTELSLATLVFYRPWRKWVLLAGVLMHLGIEYRMNIPLFAFIMIATYASFFEGDEISVWAKNIGEKLKRFRIEVMTPQNREVSPGPASAFAAMDPFELVRIEPGKGDRFALPDGRSASLAWSFRAVGCWVFAWIPGVWRAVTWRSLSPPVSDAAESKVEQASAK